MRPAGRVRRQQPDGAEHARNDPHCTGTHAPIRERRLPARAAGTTSVITYAIDGCHGRTATRAPRRTWETRTALAGEPQGRYVFAAIRAARRPPLLRSVDRDVRSRARRAGSLTKVSEASSEPIWCRGCSPMRPQRRLVLALGQQHASLRNVDDRNVPRLRTTAYVTHAFADDGQLGPAYVRRCSMSSTLAESSRSTSTSDVLLQADAGRRPEGARRRRRDGRLRGTGESHLCVGSPMYPEPLLAVSGLRVWPRIYCRRWDEATVCSWKGSRLAPHANLGVDAGYAVARRSPSGGARCAPRRSWR